MLDFFIDLVLSLVSLTILVSFAVTTAVAAYFTILICFFPDFDF